MAYQGWANYETWAVALWVGNDEGLYERWEKGQAEECYRDAVEGDADGDRESWSAAAADALAGRMKDEFEDEGAGIVPGGTLWADLMSAALSEVDWDEIAANYVGDLDRAAIEAEVRAEA